jgi:hypothetical protein
MSQEYAQLDEVLAEQFDDIARSQHVQQTVDGGLFTATTLHPEDESATRAALWKEFSSRYPEALASRSAPEPRERDLGRIDVDTGPITFRNGVPVGGHAQLSLFSDGTYAFSGHFHVSGAPSYNYALAIVVADRNGRPIPFAHGGRLHGTFESGSRDDDWAKTDREGMISQLWGAGLGASWRWTANVNIDVRAAINSAIQAAGYVAAVAAVIA